MSADGPSDLERADALSPLQTVDRALQILLLFTPVSPEVTVAQVARTLGVNRSIASRLLSALEVRRFVVQDPGTGRFRLGVRTLDLGALFLQSSRIVQAATPYLEILASAEPALRANLYVLDQGEAVRLAAYPARPLTRLRLPAHSTAAGKVLLAGLPDVELDRLLAQRPLAALTPYTVTDPATLFDVLREVRARGYATDNQEIMLGAYCYAAPIRDVGGRTVAAVSGAFGMVKPPEPERVERVIQLVSDTGYRISEALGAGAMVGSPADANV
jgi:DNA-binding IclR family transcriptional regulator